MSGKNILITGGAGFAGSTIAILLKTKYPSYTIFALDNLKRRGSEINLNRFAEHNIRFIHGDIRLFEDLDVFDQLDIVIDAAAEPSVLAGTKGNTNYVIKTNLNGTVNTLDLAKKHKASFIFLSTSRVYPINAIENIKYKEEKTRYAIAGDQELAGISEKGISEGFSLEGFRSIYGSTKLASELIINEYNAFFNLKTVINRCAVLTGPFQMGKIDQGVIVLWLASHLWNKNLSYIGYGGSGKQVRDILHINDLFKLVDFQIHNMDKVNGKLYNVGGGSENSISLMELTSMCEEITGNKITIHPDKTPRTGDIRVYITDNTKVSRETNWKPEIGLRVTLEDTFNWIKSYESQFKKIFLNN
jgi:CDP-paratose 2-epimerase